MATTDTHTNTPMSQPVAIKRRLAAVVAALDEAFDRMETGRRSPLSCTNCLHCKVYPAAVGPSEYTDKPTDYLPQTECSKGRWERPVWLGAHVDGKAGPLRHRQECPDFVASR